MSEGEQYFYLSGEGRKYPAEDLFGYTDSLIIARLRAAYNFGSQLIHGRENKVVADLGSGHGHGAVAIREFLTPETIISGDIDFTYVRAQSLALADGHTPYQFVQLNTQDLPLAAGSLDNVFLMHVLEHLSEPEKTLDEMRRVLRPGRELVVATPWIKNLVGRNALDEHVYDAKELEELLCSAGFESEIYYITADSQAYAVHNRKRRLAKMPFAAQLRRMIPMALTENFLRHGISKMPLSQDNFSVSREPSNQAIDLLAIAS